MPALRVIGGVLLISLAAAALVVSRRADSSVAPRPAAALDSAMVITGVESQTTTPFFLDGGSYHAIWSAWGQTPNEPPCTHSIALMSLAADGSAAVAQTLAKSVQVPYTGAGGQVDLTRLAAGDYYLQINSACAWQIELNPSA